MSCCDAIIDQQLTECPWCGKTRAAYLTEMKAFDSTWRIKPGILVSEMSQVINNFRLLHDPGEIIEADKLAAYIIRAFALDKMHLESIKD